MPSSPALHRPSVQLLTPSFYSQSYSAHQPAGSHTLRFASRCTAGPRHWMTITPSRPNPNPSLHSRPRLVRQVCPEGHLPTQRLRPDVHVLCFCRHEPHVCLPRSPSAKFCISIHYPSFPPQCACVLEYRELLTTTASVSSIMNGRYFRKARGHSPNIESQAQRHTLLCLALKWTLNACISGKACHIAHTWLPARFIHLGAYKSALSAMCTVLQTKDARDTWMAT